MLNRLKSFFNSPSLSNLSSLQLFQLIRYGSYVLIGIGFAKLSVSLTQIGLFETFILINGLLSFFWVSGFINTLLSLYHTKNADERGELLFNTFLSLLFFSFIAALSLYFFARPLLGVLNKSGNSEIVTPAVIYLFINCPTFINEYILFLHEKRKVLLAYSLVSFFFTLVAALLPIVLGYDMLYSFYALILVAVCKLLFSLLMLNQYGSFVFNAAFQISLFTKALPLMLSLFISGSAEYIDGLIVKWKFDDMFFAIYRYGAKELPILLIVSNTLSTAMLPAISSNLQEGLAVLKSKSAKLMHLFFPLTILLLLSSGWLYKIVFSENFTYSAIIFNIYLLLIIPRILFPQTILTGRGQTKFLLISSILEITINISVSIYMAGKIGLPGIAIGTFVAYCFDKVFLITVNYLKNGIHPSAYIKLLPFSLYTIATLLAFAFGNWLMK